MPDAEEGLYQLAVELNGYITSHQLNNAAVIIPSGKDLYSSLLSRMNVYDYP